jgi:hypothetical protein
MTLAVAGSVCLHLVLFSRLPSRPLHALPAKPGQPLTVTLLPSPASPTVLSLATAPVAPPVQAMEVDKATPPRKRLATRQRATATVVLPKAAQTRAFSPPDATEASTPAPVSTQSPPPLNLALPSKGRALTAPGASAAQGTSNELRKAIQSRIEADRLQQRAPAVQATQTTQIHERVGSDGTRRARIDTPWGAYCLDSPRPGAPHDARMPTQTAVPRTCP